jgi:hydroxymethylpyrimidine pyrophosphatase-like HAD family hydrolase
MATGRRLVMVTRRELPELLRVFPEINMFEWVVAEDGGLVNSNCKCTKSSRAEYFMWCPVVEALPWSIIKFF